MARAERRWRRRIEVLRAVAEELNRHAALKSLLEASLPLIVRLLGLQTGWIVLLDEQGRFSLAAACGLPPALASGDCSALRWSPCRCQRMLLSGELRGSASIVECERLQQIYQALAGTDQRTLSEQTGDLRAHVSVPLRSGNRALGIMNLARPGPAPLDRESLALLDLVSQALGTAIERARLHAEVEAARRKEQETAATLAQTLLGLTTLQEVGAAVFGALKEVLQPDGLSLLVADPSGSFLELTAGWGWSEAYVGRLRLPIHPPQDNGPAWALHVRQPVLEDHTKPTAPFAVPDPVRRAGVRACLNLPLISGDHPTGVIVADYQAPRPVGEDQLRFATVLAGIAAAAVARVLEHERHRTLFENLPIGLYRSTPQGVLLDVNGALVRLLGYPDRAVLLATHAAKLYANPEDRERWQKLMEREGVLAGFEVQWRRFDGTRIWVRESARVVRDAAGRAVYYEGAVEDVTARKRFEEELHYLANHDPLTGVFNRRRFLEELSRQMAQARRSGHAGAVLFLDLDNFKEVNDRLGHRAGDTLLQEVVRAMRHRLREGEILARLGGDEFGVIVFPVDADRARAVAQRVLDAIRGQEVLLSGRPFRLTASCGVALFPDHGLTAEEVLAAADLSLYAAKYGGTDRIELYAPNPAQRQRLQDPAGWAGRLADALARNRMVAYAQPILDLHRGEVTQYELLVRLAEPAGLVEPAAFLPVAERLGLIGQIDLWAFRQALDWAARRGVRIHVNLSGKTVGDQETIQAMLQALDASEVPASRLVLEITETAALVELAQTLRCMETLRARGCQFALDDFGVGFASLYYLRRLPVDYLKIDGSFVRALTIDPENQAIVRAIADLARGLGRSTIAEWVEDPATLDMVRALGIDYAQGYQVGRPVPLSEL